MRVLLVVNPRSRSGEAARWVPAALHALRRRASVERIEMSDRTASAVAERLSAGGWDRVVALGGDGTFARVADGVLDAGSEVPLAVLPAGLANNHGRGLGVPTVYDDLEAAVDAVFAPGASQMDVGLVDGARFYDAVGFGFQASALARRERIRGRPGLGGELGYAVAAARELPGAHGFAVEAEVDGGAVRWPRALDVVVSNTLWYGGRWVLDRGARVDDGMFEVVAVRGWRDLLRRAVTDLRGGVADRRGQVISLAFDREVASQIDGEVGPSGRAFRVEVLPGRLRVVRSGSAQRGG